jgi:hypothetical protein
MTTPEKPNTKSAEPQRPPAVAVDYDTWFRAQVEAAVLDTKPSIPDEAAKVLMAERRAAIKRKAVASASASWKR